MKKKIFIGSIVAIIIVLSTFSSVVGKVASEDELVEFDVEFCGLGRKHTVRLTPQEAENVKQLFDDIEQRLSEVETREEAEVIFKEAVVELERHRMFGNLKIDDVTKVITQNSINQFARGNGINYDNRFCFVYLNSGDTGIFPIDINIFVGGAFGIYLLSNIFGLKALLYLSGALGIYSQIKPFRFMNCLIVDNVVGASFNVYSLGLYGFKK